MKKIRIIYFILLAMGFAYTQNSANSLLDEVNTLLGLRFETDNFFELEAGAFCRIVYNNNYIYIIDDEETHQGVTYLWIYDLGGNLILQKTLPYGGTRGLTSGNGRIYNITIDPSASFNIYSFPSDLSDITNNSGEINIQTDMSFNLSSDNNDPRGMAYFNNQFYIIDGDDYVYIYDNDGEYQNRRGIAGSHRNAIAMTVYNGYLYSLDIDDERVYVHDALSGQRNVDLEFDLLGLSFGITSYLNFIMTTINHGVAFYDVAGNYLGGGGIVPTDSFSLTSGGNNDPQGMVFYNNKFWIVDHDNDKVFAYNINGTRSSSHDFSIAGYSQGMEFYDNHFWIINDVNESQSSSAELVYVHNINGERDDSKTFALENGVNDDPRGIAYYDNKFWIVDHRDNKVYVYTTNGVRQSMYDFNLDTLNNHERGMAYYDNKFWVVDIDDDKIYSYSTNGTRLNSSDIEIPLNNIPYGLAFFNNRVYVTETIGDSVYSYSLE